MARDNWVFNGVRPNLFKVVEPSLRSFSDFHIAKSPSLDIPPSPPAAAVVPSSPASWSPMLDGSFKINYDPLTLNWVLP